MKEQGIVLEIYENTAKIRLLQKPECAKCGLCTGSSGGFRVLSIKTDKPLQINQTVTLEINEQILTLSSILLYGVPLTGFVMGAIIGYMIGKELVATIFAIGLSAVDFLIVKYFIKKQNLAEKAAKISED
jgi:positive regulator of sigma E activity